MSIPSRSFRLAGLALALMAATTVRAVEPEEKPHPLQLAQGGPRRFFDSLFNRSPSPAEAPRPRRAFIPAPRPARPGELPERPEATAETIDAELPESVDEWRAFAGDLLVAVSQTAERSLGVTIDLGIDVTREGDASEPTGPTLDDAAGRTQSRDEDRESKPSRSSLARPSGPPPPKTRQFERMRLRIARTLAAYQRRPLNTAENTPWEVMHGFIAFGIPTQLRVGGPGGTPVNAIGWMNMGGRCRGQVLLVASEKRVRGLIGYGVQGHSAQYLAMLAQCRVAKESPITIQKRSFTVADLVTEEQQACRPGTELTFSLIGLAHYLPTDATWKSRDGEEWSLPRLVEEELAQPVRTVACGGTHRLFGLAYACQRRKQAIGSLDGVYRRADRFVRDYQAFAVTKLQNRDGSFSTEWFKYPADRPDDIDRKVQTTGHILEWLVASLDQEQLYDSRIVRAVEFLEMALASDVNREWKIGPLGHALHALTIYQERVWGVVLPGSIAAFHGPMKADPSGVERVADGPILPPQTHQR